MRRIYYLFLIYFWSLINASEPEIKPLIKQRLIKNNQVYFYLETEFSKKYIRQALLLSYPADIDLNALPSSIVDVPLITNIIPVVWLSGEKYMIEEMDEDLYYSLIKIKEFFKRFFYNTAWQGELIPKRLVKNIMPNTDLTNTNNPKKINSAALFTGGLDSTTTVLRHFDENLSLISFNNPHEHTIDFAKKHQFNYYTIHMNYYDFLKLTQLDKASIDITKWFWDTTMGLSWVGAATPLLYAKGITTLYIPSGFTWQSFVFSDGQTLRQPACPLIDENLSPAGLKVEHDIFTMTRTDKIKFICNFCTERKISKPKLVVCNNHDLFNTGTPCYLPCHECIKCYLTMLDILAIGEKLKDFGFTISKHEFITKFKNYLNSSKIRRGGTYAACHDTQQFLKQNIKDTSPKRLAFYDWFISIDLEAMIYENKISNRPARTVPFRWSDYQDLYAKPIPL